MLRLLLAGIILFSIQASAQKFADKNYYLVGPLEYDKVSPEYQYLIDNNLAYYHAAKSDMERITYVNQIVKLCWDENVWPKYNQWIYDYTTEKLNEPQTDTVRYLMLQALAGSIYYIGWNFGVQTNYEACIAWYQKCTDIYVEIKDSIGIANSLDNVGSVYLIKGESAKALDFFTKALEIRKRIGHIVGTGASLISIGTIHLEHGDYLNSLQMFQQGKSYYEKGNYPAGVSSALNNLGSIETYFGNYQKALTYFQQSLEIKTQLGDKQGIANSLTQVGNVCLILGDFKNAMIHFEEGLELYQQVGDQRGIAASYCNMALVYRAQNNYKKAIKLFNQSLLISEEIGAILEERSVLENLFYTHVFQGNYIEAEKEILEIISIRLHDVNVNFPILPEQKKELYLSTMAADFMNLYALADLRKNENRSITEIAYNNALKLKGLLLKSTTAMRESILTSGDVVLIEEYNQWINLKIEIANRYATGTETSELDSKADEIEKDLIKNSVLFSEYSNTTEPTWKDIQSKLNSGEAAIEFIHFSSEIGNDTAAVQYAALLVTPDSEFPAMVDLCTSAQLEAILGTNKANNLDYIQTIYGTALQPKSNLYQLIWQPLEKNLEGITRVYFSATGLLHKISFAALTNPDGKFLCDRYQLINLSSTSQLLNEKAFEFTKETTLSMFGGVKYSTSNTKRVIWNYLPGTKAEIDSIAVQLKNHLSLNSYNDENASEENFKKAVSSSNFIHIATHGFFYPDPDLIQKETYKETTEENLDFRGGGVSYGIWNFVNNKNPLMRSGIAFAGANDMWDRSIFAEGEDGVLTAQEVTTLNMRNTELVVLSACETGLGDIKGDEGVYGLQRAFKMAGARFLIMSLWQVPDEETAEFMICFYHHLLIQKDIRKAFVSAQQIMRDKYDPYYWAAFVLVE